MKRIPVTIHNLNIKDIIHELENNFLAYSEYVIKDRSLPDLRDGLKPVHRRILWIMWDMGLKHNNQHKKCARVVGNVIGKVHPHGDSAVYSALVRLAQSFVLNNKVVDGKGNFGNIDGSSAASMRYTECKLERFAEIVYFSDIKEDTVDFVDNYDGTEKEPSVLPARLPMSLLMSPSGIAVGMSTDFLPHNLNEVCNAILAYLKNNNVRLSTLVKHIQGPEFPLSGKIRGEFNSIYKNGNGSFTYESLYDVEKDRRKTTIVFRSIPYLGDKSKLMLEIGNAVQDGKIDGITDLRDESDKEGIRIAVDIKRGYKPDDIVQLIFKHTNFMKSISTNMVAIVDSKPKKVDLFEIISNFVEFRRGVICRRTEFRKRKAEEEKEIVDGILIAINDFDKVINIIRNSDDPVDELKSKVGLSQRQADYVFNMPLRRISKLDGKKYSDRQRELSKWIKEQDSILSDEKKIDNIIKIETREIMKEFGENRKTEILP